MSDLDSVFGALGDATRRGMCERLREGERTISDVAAPYLKEMTFPAITKHLNVLEKAGLIRRRKAGRTCLLQLQPERFEEAVRYCADFRGTAPEPRPPGAGAVPDFEIGIND